MNDMDLEKVKEFYGTNLIVKDFDLEISKLLTEEENYILFDFGLPIVNENYLDFNFKEKKITQKGKYLEIGLFQENKNAPIFIDLNDYEVKTNFYNLFSINSSLKKMLLCSFEYENFTEKKKEVKKIKEKLKILQTFKENMYKIDPDMDDKGYYWGSIIEDYEIGMLFL